jgi:hypothetical protein
LWLTVVFPARLFLLVQVIGRSFSEYSCCCLERRKAPLSLASKEALSNVNTREAIPEPVGAAGILKFLATTGRRCRESLKAVLLEMPAEQECIFLELMAKIFKLRFDKVTGSCTSYNLVFINVQWSMRKPGSVYCVLWVVFNSRYFEDVSHAQRTALIALSSGISNLS